MIPLNVLLIEDSEDDAALVVRTLTSAGFAVSSTCVQTAETLRRALEQHSWDVAIADHTMPNFSGTRALGIVRDHSIDLPFIFVSGTIGEDVAVAAMRQGAHDYIIKGNLTRLPAAVERELREASVRRERTRANQRAVYLAYHDPLTELPNRSLLSDRLQMAVLTCKRESQPLCFMVLDLDNFKEVNDALGHFTADRLLQQVAARLRWTMRESDTVARLGGDEFAMLLPITDLEGAVAAAHKLLAALDQPFVLDGRPLVVRASIGIAAFPTHAGSVHELLQKADSAMYAAKTKRSGFSVAIDGADNRNEQRLALTMSMRQGIEKEQFELDYQPIVALSNNRVIGVEGLMRWRHPEQGRLMPDDFIRLAEQTGMITALTEFSIERALSDWTQLRDGHGFTIAANLSPQCLHNPSFPDRIRYILTRYRVDPACLILEITENVLMLDPEKSTRCLADLRGLGVRIALDDFGTGYSSLSYLRRLPVDELKIDRSFVIGLASGENDALVRSIIDLAHNLGLRVVAEGVENEAVADQLRALGCDAAQGYHIHRPASAQDVIAWMESQRL